MKKVQFISRFYDEGQSIQPEKVAKEDDVGNFISKIEKSEKSFQRTMAKTKIKAIKNFYETANSQPPIPGSVLLFTSQALAFEPLGSFQNVGNLEEPSEKYLIIDGQHRLAALYFYQQSHPEEAGTIHVPCVIFDGHSDDFAAEMFVIINSTPTRINKSHLVDLYERVSWAEPDRRFAAQVVEMLYSEADSPLRYRINRLGGRSKQEKWILQAELFNELHRWVKADWERITEQGGGKRMATKYYEATRDFLKAAAIVFKERWGVASSMITKPVTLKALLRVCGDLAREDFDPVEGRVGRWVERMQPWASMENDFRKDGFYERFPAKGQVERVARIHKYLAKPIGVEIRAPRSARTDD